MPVHETNKQQKNKKQKTKKGIKGKNYFLKFIDFLDLNA